MFQFQPECEVRIAPLHGSKLAAQRTEPERVKEASATNLTGVGDTLSRPGLWALIQKYNLRTVDNVGLNARYVDVLLNFINPHHVVVRGSSYLNNAVILVMDQTVGTEGISHTIQTKHIAFALIRISMNTAGNEVASSQHWLQPRRTQMIVPHSPNRTHHHFFVVRNLPLLIIDSQSVQLWKHSRRRKDKPTLTREEQTQKNQPEKKKE